MMPEENEMQEDHEAMLEMMYINEYLKGQGYASMKSLCDLPDEQAKKLMIEACKYASARLAEVESKGKFRKKIKRAS